MIFDNKLFAYYWGGIITILPFYIRVTEITNMRLSRDLFFSFAVMLSLILFGIRKDIYKINWKIPSIFIFAVISLHYNQWHQYAEYVILHFFYLSCGMLLCIQMICNFDKDHETIIINSIAIAGLGQSLFLLFNIIHVDLYEYIIKYVLGIDNARKSIPSMGKVMFIDATFKGAGVMGSLMNKHLSGSFLAICLPALFRKKWCFGLLLAIPALIASSCATPIITAFIGLMAWLYFKWFHHIKLVFFGCLSSVFGLMAWSTNFFRNDAFLDNSHRFKVWLLSVTWFTDLSSILFGRGPAYFRDNFTPTFFKVQGYNKIFSQAHNEYIELYVMSGIIGLILLVILLKQINFKSNLILLSCLVAACANMGTSFPLHISSMALIIVTCYSLTIKQKIAEDFSHGNDSNKGF